MMLYVYHNDVRTTLTLDDDVANLLDREMRRSGLSFKETVNSSLRKGLTVGESLRRPFKVRPRALGLPAGLSYDSVAELLEVLEGPQHK